jgi:hypothetical protein
MNLTGDYNRDQWVSFKAIQKACETLSSNEIERLKETVQHYLVFRSALDDHQQSHILPFCHGYCFTTGLSACCGFESIYTFFADQVINFLFSSPQEREALFQVLEQRNQTQRCVYLGANGCLWLVSPITCAMFLCDQAKRTAAERHPETLPLWEDLKRREKEFTWPVKPVLFDEIEKYFMQLGVESPYMYFHRSPGLVRLKAKSGCT